MLLLIVDVMDINYFTIWRLFSSLFSPAFTLFSQPLAIETLPILADNGLRSFTGQLKTFFMEQL